MTSATIMSRAGVMEEECAKIMQDFFRQVVNVKKKPNNDWLSGNKARYVNKSASQRDLHLMEEECFVFPEDV